jgi:sigma-B regulation protein RsbU (phosphoserine phosphatase)
MNEQILIVDDTPANIQILAETLKGKYQLSVATNGKQALEMLERVRPDLILLDVMMPELDGFETCRRIKSLDAWRDVPIIFLTSKSDTSDIVTGFEVGAVDYVAKPFNTYELLARIHTHLTIDQLRRSLEEKNAELAGELAKAAAYVRSMLPEPLSNEFHTEWKFIPSMQLGGDSFGYHWLDEDHLAIFLLDVTGHGVGAALLSVSVLQVLRSRSLPSADFRNPAEVLSNLNQAFPMQNNNRMFFTMWYGVYNKVTRQLRYCSGGHPPAVLLTGPNEENSKVMRLSTPCLFVGVFAGAKYENAECTLGEFGELFVYSDGVYEVTAPDDTMMELDDFIDVLTRRNRSVPALDFIYKYVTDFQKSESFADDFSILSVRFG